MDIFIKALVRDHFRDILDKLGIRNLHAPTWGGVVGNILNFEFWIEERS